MDSFNFGVSIYYLITGQHFFRETFLTQNIGQLRDWFNKSEESWWGDFNMTKFYEKSQSEINALLDKTIEEIPSLYLNKEEAFIAQELIKLSKSLIVKDPEHRKTCAEVALILSSLQETYFNK